MQRLILGRVAGTTRIARRQINPLRARADTYWHEPTYRARKDPLPCKDMKLSTRQSWGFVAAIHICSDNPSLILLHGLDQGIADSATDVHDSPSRRGDIAGCPRCRLERGILTNTSLSVFNSTFRLGSSDKLDSPPAVALRPANSLPARSEVYLGLPAVLEEGLNCSIPVRLRSARHGNQHHSNVCASLHVSRGHDHEHVSRQIPCMSDSANRQDGIQEQGRPPHSAPPGFVRYLGRSDALAGPAGPSLPAAQVGGACGAPW